MNERSFLFVHMTRSYIEMHHSGIEMGLCIVGKRQKREKYRKSAQYGTPVFLFLHKNG